MTDLGYSVEQVGPNEFLVRNYMGEETLTLKGGYAHVIVLSFMNMTKAGPHRGDDYMAGVVAGCVHMEMLRGEHNVPRRPEGDKDGGGPQGSGGPDEDRRR